MKKTIGKNIRRARKLAGYTQKQLAELLGHRSAAMISWVEDGRRNITAEKLYRIALVTNTPIDTFFNKK